MKKTNIVSQRIVAALVTVFASLLVLRWLINIPLLDVVVRTGPRLGLNGPLMLLATGASLYLSTLSKSSTNLLRVVQIVLVGCVGCLSVAILIEHMFNISLGIDFVRGPIAPTAETPTPGRVAPNACLGFLFAAIAMWLASRTSRSVFQRHVMVGSVGAVMLIASTALIGFALNLSTLYQFANFNRMLPPTAVGLLFVSVGLWFKLQELLDQEDVSVEAFERRITRRSAGILAAMAVSTGVAGFAILESSIDTSTSQNLMATTLSDGAALSAALETRLWFAKTMQTRPKLAEVLVTLTGERRDQKTLLVLQGISSGLFSSGATWVRFTDVHDDVLTEFGVSKGTPNVLHLPLNAEGQTAALIWNDGFLLRTETPIFLRGQLVGRIALEQDLPTFRSVMTAVQANNNSTELVICGHTKTTVLCAPSRFYAKPRLILLNAQAGKENSAWVPTAFNKSELLLRKDIRGVTTLAAYTPLEDSGIGITLKIDADSLVAPLREHVVELVLVIAALVAVGAAVARLQILPLLAQVSYEQTRNSVILANANDAFIGMDADGRVTAWNAKAESMFHWPTEDAVGQYLSELIVPVEHRHAHAEGVAKFKISGQGSVLNQQLEVMALRRDGSLLPVELSVTGFHDGKSHIANAFIRDISARKATEKKLADSERFIRTITNNLPALVGYVDMDERYRFANSGYQTMMGIDPKGIIGKTISEVLGEETRKAIDPYIAQVKSGTAAHFERRGIEPGRPGYFATDYIPDIAPNGTVLGFFIHVIDTSAKKHSESQLRQSEQRLKAVTDNLPALITHVDASEKYTFVNAYVFPTFGIDPGKMIGYTIRQIGGEDFYRSIEQQVKACLNGDTVNFEGVIHAKGKDLFYQANYVPEFDGNGVVTGFYAITFDITDRKGEELLRRQSEERLRLITDNLPVLISYLDSNRRFQFGNATFLTWLGVDPVQIAGKFMVDIVGEEAYEERRSYIDGAFAGETIHFDITTVALGVRRVLHTVYVPHISSSGTVDGLYTISTDVTRLKDTENELASLARVDQLTDLPNRRQFDERMDEALARYQRTGQPLALMFLDVDKFKGINDGLGHAAGDEVLRQFANRLKKCVRKTDIVARYAGDEFVIIVDGYKAPTELDLIAKKILISVRKPMAIGDMSLHVTATIGITKIDSQDKLAGPVIARADEALYVAKRAGRDRYHKWTATPVSCSPSGSPWPIA